MQVNLPEAGRMKVRQFPLPLAPLGAALLALWGCGRGPEPLDSSSPEITASTQTVSSTETAPANQAPATKPGWITSYEQAQQEAKTKNKLVLIDFTGSDWCGWCKLLDREVFSKPEFKEYASKNLVLVEVDFPKMKVLSDAARTQNILLAQRFQIQAFPTIIVLNSDGKMVGELGYMKGGPPAFIEVLEKLRKG